MPSRPAPAGRHRLGLPGSWHCVEHAAVATALEEHRRTWFTGLLTPARHSLAGLRRRAVAPDLRWAVAAAG
ncbi:hypothetical protein GCM10027047_18420 [Rhodococcus aerolatus]